MAYTKQQRRKYMQRRRTTYREELIARLGGVCASCGTADALEFDHVDPTTKVRTIADMISTLTTGAAMDEELDKCQLLCHGCHVKKSRKEGAFVKNKPLGEEVWSAKLSEDEVREIRRSYKKGCRIYGCRALARRYGVSHGVISRILSRKIWAHVH